MLDCLLAASALQTSEYWGSGCEPRRLGARHPRNAPYQAFEAADGTFILAAGSDRLWQEVCEELGRTALASDARFARQSDRARNQVELEQILSPIFKQCTAGEWIERFGRRGIPCGPVNTFGDAVTAGRIRGAVLDVYGGELAGRPPRPELAGLPQVLLTPHISASGEANMAGPLRQLFADNLRRYLDGQPLLNVVDRTRGY